MITRRQLNCAIGIWLLGISVAQAADHNQGNKAQDGLAETGHLAPSSERARPLDLTALHPNATNLLGIQQQVGFNPDHIAALLSEQPPRD